MPVRSFLVALIAGVLLLNACASDPFAEQLSLGDRYMAEKNWDAAISAYQKALKIDPKSSIVNSRLALAYNNRGWVFNGNEMWDDAITDFNSALKYSKDLALAYNNRGFAYNGKGQSALGDAYILLNSGDAKSALKEMDKAIGLCGQSIDNLKQALTLDSNLKEIKLNLADSYNDRGHAYNLKKEWDKAIPDLNNAIALNPNLAQAFNNRGWAYNGKKDWDTAIPDCSRAIELDPNMALAYNNRGWAYHEKEKYNQALDDLNKAITLNPKLTVAYMNRAITYYYLGNKELCIKDCQTVLNMTKHPELVSAAKQLSGLAGGSPKK